VTDGRLPGGFVMMMKRSQSLSHLSIVYLKFYFIHQFFEEKKILSFTQSIQTSILSNVWFFFILDSINFVHTDKRVRIYNVLVYIPEGFVRSWDNRY
jgi:hypothetical protein